MAPIVAALKPKSQFLLKRNPALSREEFSEHWYHRHGAIVAPYFMANKFRYYAQIHGSLATSDSDLGGEIGSWDGAAESKRSADPSSDSEPAWKKAYYDEVNRADERRCLVEEALLHYRLVEPGTVRGRKRVVIEEGNCVIDIPEDVMRLWKEYEARGNKAAEKET